jgi:hypothetical protein
VTVTATWRKSSFSSPDANCVEVAFGEVVGVRDSKNTAPELSFPVDAWTVFLADR